MANGRCRMHGGNQSHGVAHHSTKTGRYSKYLPARLAARYQESQDDETLLGLRDEVSLLDARLAELLGRVDTGESGAAWSEAATALGEFRKAVTSGDATGRLVAFAAMEEAIERGQSDTATWDDIHKAVEQRRRLVESERKHLEQMGQMVAVGQVMLMIGQIVELLRENVHDRDALVAISSGINRIVGATSGRR